MGQGWRTATPSAAHLAEVRWSGPALDDAEAIRDYIATHNPSAAERVFDRLMAAGDGLETFPDRGRERDDGRRELTTVSPYVIVYRHTSGIVDILRIRHGARGP